MRDVPENELFSAYLDGELSAAEQARVEELLARSPRARQLLDELRALSSTLQGLPPHKLDEDLSERVLRVGERRLLAERPAGRGPAPAPSAGAGPSTPASAPAVPPPPDADGGSRLRRMLSPRALGWSIMAVAVALLIMAFEPGRVAKDEDDRDVARAPQNGAEATPHPEEHPPVPAIEKAGDRSVADGEAAAGQALKGGGRRWGGAGEAPTGPSAGETREPGPAAEPAPSEEEAAEAHDFAEGVGPAPAAEMPAPEQPFAEMPPPADQPAAAEEPAAPEMPAPAPAPVTPAEPGESALADAAAPPPARPGAVESPMAPQAPGPDHLAANGHRREIDGVEDEVAGKGPAGGLKLGPGRGGGAGAAGQGAGSAARFGAAGRAAQNYRVEPADDAVLLVHCDVSPGTAQGRVFDRLLVDNGIRWEPSSKSRDRRSRPSDLPEIQKKQEHEEQSEQRALSGEPDDEAAGPVELVYVEASLAQIESTLASLKRRPGEFPTVSVKPAPGMAWQKGFSYRYNREQAAQTPADEPPGSAHTLPPADRPDLRQSKAGTDAPEEGGQLSADGFAGPHGRAQRLTLPGEGPAPDGEPPELRTRNGQGDAYGDPFGGRAPGPPRKAPGAYPQPSDRPPADKKPDEPRLYRVLFVLRVVPPGDVAGQAIAADGPAARAAEAAVEAMPAAAPEAAAEPAAEPPPNPAAGGGPSP